MKLFNKNYISVNYYINNNRKPDFNNILKILCGQTPSRPTLYEFYPHKSMNDYLLENISYDKTDLMLTLKNNIDTFKTAGYDYVQMHGCNTGFKTNRHRTVSTVSLNDGAVISDRDSFNKYEWPDFENADYSILEKVNEFLPEGMKVIVMGPNGVLETVIALVGYENLCYLTVDDPDFVQDIFDNVGSRFVKYYETCSGFDSVGALMSNDDWGFNTQTLLSLSDMKKYVVPWHKKIVETIHRKNKPVILHSCGMLDLLMDDIINYIKYDAKHSYEDKIRPVEDAYEKYSNEIAVMGGIDIDFLCKSTPEKVYKRSVEMLERTESRGGYALGSGNSIPRYVPLENYLAMIAAAVFY